MSAQPVKLTTARKVHRCELCGFPIYIGERYVYERFPPWKQYESGGDFWTLKACRFCYESPDCWNEDYILNTEYFQEWVLEHWMAVIGWPGQEVYGDPSWWSKANAELSTARRLAWAEVSA